MTDFGFYIFALIVIVVAFMLLKKIATCLIKTIVMLIVIAVLAYIYITFIAV